MPLSRRRFVIALPALALAVAGLAHAQEVSVPIAIQADLLVKVAAYDRNLPNRAGDRVRTLLVSRPGNNSSSRVAGQMAKAMEPKEPIAGLPHEEILYSFSDGAALARACRDRRIAVVYLAPGFSDGELASIAEHLDGVDVLTVAALADYVPKRVVLGFDLVSGKTKLLVHLAQARRQRVALSSEVLKMATVIE
jgi:hypothetical protein